MLNIALADDRMDGLKELVYYLDKIPGIKLVIKAVNGHDLIVQMHKQDKLPDIVLMDINMPVIDGIAATYFLRLQYPSVKVIGLSIYDDFDSVKHIIKSGARGYVLKAAPESVIDKAISEVIKGRKYIDERIEFDKEKLNMLLAIDSNIEDEPLFGLTKRERMFVILNASMLTYEQIAQLMFVETKTIQTYFDRVSKKLSLTSRQALTVFSFQNGLAQVANLTKRPI
ncbi:MAG: response regulator transcription factor [Sediminibacterium sp.]